MTIATHKFSHGEWLDVRDYGNCVFDGVTNNGAALRAAVAACPVGGTIYIPPSASGFLTDMATITQQIRIAGDDSKVIVTFLAASSSAGLQSDTYKASPAFLVKNTADHCTIEGIYFTQDGTFPTTYNTPSGYISGATLAPVIVQGADYVTVRNCTFETTTGRGVYWRGGDYGKITGNTFIESSVIAHIGEVSSTLFWDASTVITTRYSPQRLIITGNHFKGSNTTRLAKNSVFLSGCYGEIVAHNQFSGLTTDSDGSNNGIYRYANDLGTYNSANANVGYSPTVIAQNIIGGTFENAISVVGDTATSGSDVKPNGVLSGNSIRGTGLGIYGEFCETWQVKDNTVITTSSPLRIADSWDMAQIAGNYFECTSAGAGNRTINVASTAELKRLNWHDNIVVMAPADIYAWEDGGGTIGLKGGRLDNTLWVLASTSADANRRPVQIVDAEDSVSFSGNIFDFTATASSGRIVASIAMLSGASLTIRASNNQAISTNATSFTSRGISVNSGTNFIAAGNDVGALNIDVTGDAAFSGGALKSAIAAVSPLIVANAARVKLTGAHVELTTANNIAVATFTACGLVAMSGCSFKANSTQPMVQMITSGSLRATAVTTENASSGARYSVTGTATIDEWPPITGTATYDPGSIASGAVDTIQTMTVTGAVLGDVVEASFSLDLQGMELAGWVSASNTVSYQFRNQTAASIDLASGTVKVRVSK